MGAAGTFVATDFLALLAIERLFAGADFFACGVFFAGVALAARNAAQRFFVASAIARLPAALILRFLATGLAGATFCERYRDHGSAFKSLTNR